MTISTTKIYVGPFINTTWTIFIIFLYIGTKLSTYESIRAKVNVPHKEGPKVKLF